MILGINEVNNYYHTDNDKMKKFQSTILVPRYIKTNNFYIYYKITIIDT